MNSISRLNGPEESPESERMPGMKFSPEKYLSNLTPPSYGHLLERRKQTQKRKKRNLMNLSAEQNPKTSKLRKRIFSKQSKTSRMNIVVSRRSLTTRTQKQMTRSGTS